MLPSKQQLVTNYDGLTLYIIREIDRIKTYHRKNVKLIHATSMILADRLAHSGDIQNALNFVIGNDNLIGKEKTEESSKFSLFLDRCRSSLKDVCNRNESSLTNTNAFIWSLTVMLDDFRKKKINDSKLVKSYRGRRPQIRKSLSNINPHLLSTSTHFDVDERLNEYLEKSIGSKMKKYLGMITKSNALTKSSMIIRCLERLGETPTNDEELQILNLSRGVTYSDLKCPITGCLFLEPVKNIVCEHVYDLDGLRQYIKNRKRAKKNCNCPIVGCNNSQVSLEQVEEDMEIKMKLRRYKMRKIIKTRQTVCYEDKYSQETIFD